MKKGTDINTLLKQSVLWIRKYFFRIQILLSLILNYGSGSYLDLFVATDTNMLSNRYLSKPFNIIKFLTISNISLNL
jgi:hypothetical protein